MGHGERGFETVDILEIIDDIDIKARFLGSEIDLSHPDYPKKRKFLNKVEKKWPYLKVNDVKKSIISILKLI